MKTRKRLVNTTTISDAEISKIIKSQADTKDELINNLSTLIQLAYEEILKDYFHTFLAEWMRKLKEELRYKPSPNKKLALYEQELERSKHSIDAINNYLSKVVVTEDMAVVLNNSLRVKENEKFLKTFQADFPKIKNTQIQFKFINLEGLEQFKNLDSKFFPKSAVELPVAVTQVTTGLAKQGYKIKYNRNNLNPTVYNGLHLEIPAQIIFRYKLYALGQYTETVSSRIKSIRFYQSDTITGKTIRNNNHQASLKRIGFKWLCKDDSIKSMQLTEIKKKLVSDGFIKEIHGKSFNKIFEEVIKPEADYIDWNNSSGIKKFGIAKGKGAISFMFYFVYLITEQFKLAEYHPNYTAYLESSFLIESKSVSEKSTDSLMNTKSEIKRFIENPDQQKQWMKTMRKIISDASKTK